MIGWLVDAAREHVVRPQTLDEDSGGVPVDRRIWENEGSAPLNAYDRYAQVVPLSTVPVSWDIGGMTARMRHEIAVILTVHGPDLARAEDERGPVALDLMLRAMQYEWANLVDPDGRQEVDTLNLRVDWGSLGLSDTDANATITLTLDTTLTL